VKADAGDARNGLSNGIRNRSRFIVLAMVILGCTAPLPAQQKGQWMPGQEGLGPGTLPAPGWTLANLDMSYSAHTLNGPNGNAIPITGSYDVWVVQNGVYYVPKFRILGGNLEFAIDQPSVANGSLTVPQFGVSSGGFGWIDTYAQPFTLGWHLQRADLNTGYAFFAPTGRYSPGATNNVGSGYWGNDWITGATFYMTKNKATSVNLFTNWEFHGSKHGADNTRVTPGQTFTTEWGVGQLLPPKKNMSMQLQLGGVGYDQWQVSADSGTVPNPLGGPPLPAGLVPFYSVHAAGVQTNFNLPSKNLSFNFKCYWEYSAHSHPLGRTIVFGGAWTLKIPKTPKP
jgi:hypothetical protein